MPLRFVFGRTGTGKTRLVLDEVAGRLAEEPWGPALLVLVPEQATFQTEQALVRRPELTGYARAQVLSFRRLAWRVLRESGGGALPVLSERAKRMVIRAILARRRDDLELFGELADRPGVVDGLARTLKELRAYGRSAEDLRAVAARTEPDGPPGLAAKLRDLALLAEEVDAHGRGRSLDPDRYLELLTAAVDDAPLLAGAELWVDGFSGFTPQELEVLGRVMRVARRVTVTLLLDAERGADPRQLDDPIALFRPSVETHLELVSRAKALGVKLEPPVALGTDGATPHRFRAVPELAHLERAVLGVRRPAVHAGSVERIRVARFDSRRDEVDALAREILRLARDEGLRFREMAVVLRDLDAYADLIEAAFTERGIPFFLDRRRPVPHHPLVELVRAALEIVAEGWPLESLLRALKTDLVPVSREDVDRLEDYAREHGLAGTVCWTAGPWRYRKRRSLTDEAAPDPREEAELAEIDAIRRAATGALLAFHERVHALERPTHRALVEALVAFLDALGVRARLESWMEEHRAAGRIEEARAEEQVWRDLLSLLDDLVEALGDLPTTREEHLRVVEAGLASLELGLIPPGLDPVVVGTIERSRHLGIRAAFVPGAVEGALPPVPDEDPMLGDGERERLAKERVGLGPTSRDQLFHEHYFGYLTLTRASEWLWLSHPGADEQGRELAPAPVLRRLRLAFPSLDTRAERRRELFEAVDDRRDLVAAVARELRRARADERAPDTPVLDALRAIAADPELASSAAPVLAAVDYEGDLARRTAPLGRALAERLYGAERGLRTSVSRLESVAWCSFQHFARHGLRLGERAERELGAAALGELKHASLERLLARLAREERAWAELEPEEARRWLDEILAGLVPRLANEVRLSDPLERERIDRTRAALEASLELLGLHARRSAFRPLAAELAFGDAGPDALPALEIDVAGDRRALIRGRIDRLDAFATADGPAFLRVIDYKSSRGGAAFDLGEVALGLQLQLVTYLLAAVRGAPGRLGLERVAPGGALYFPVHDPVASLEVPPEDEEARRQVHKHFKTSGILSADPDVIEAMDREVAERRDELVPASFKADGSLAARSSVATPERMAALFEHVERTTSALAGRVLDGEVGVEPAYLGPNRTACRFCSLRAVCRFDPMVEGQRYRRLARPRGDDAWARIEGEDDGALG